MLDKLQQQALKRLIRDDSWDILLKALDEYITELNDIEKISGANEFETLRAIHTIQGKIEGVKEFFNKLEQADYS